MREATPLGDVVQDLLALRAPEARIAYLVARPQDVTAELAQALHDRAEDALREDPQAARGLADLTAWIADQASAPRLRASAGGIGAQASLLLGAFGDALMRAEQTESDAAEHGALDGDGRFTLASVRLQALVHLEEDERARVLGNELLSQATAAAHRGREIWVRMTLADLAFREDRPRRAMTHYAAIDNLLPEQASPSLRGAIASNRANALQALNRFRAAERSFADAMAHFDGESLAHARAQVAYNAAYAKSMRGRYAEALRAYSDLVPVFEELGDARHLAHIDLDRAEIHLQLGMHVDALADALRAAPRFASLEMRKEQAQSVFFAGRAAEHLAEPVKAAAHYAQAEEAFRTHGMEERALGCLAQRARLCLSTDPKHTEDLLDQAEASITDEMNPLAVAAVHLVRARAFAARGQHLLAADHASSVLERCATIEAPWLVTEANWIRGRALVAGGQVVDGIDAYRLAVESLERNRVGVPPDEYMTAFLAQGSGLYEELVAALVERGDRREAFGFAERAKARALVDLLAARSDEPRPTNEQPKARRVRHLRERLTAIYRRLSHEDGGNESRSARALRHVRAEAERLEDEVARLVRDRRLRDVASLASIDAPDLRSVQQRLEHNVTLVTYFLTEKAVVIFAVTRDETHVVRHPLDRSRFQQALQRFQFHLARHERGGDMLPETADLLLRATRNNLAKLSALLIDPIAHALSTKRLVIVPHGPLHKVPFHALPYGDGWLADAHEVTYVPSTAVYELCRDRLPTARGPAAVLALPDAQAPRIAEEAHAVAEALGTDRVHMGEAATYACLAEAAATARILHVATHGMFRLGQPMLSSIRLADRWVNLYDLYDLEINGELVVLSTCESGVAGVSDGNEILGLGRGILCAGAPALLASQWRVNDAVTTILMSAFYQRLQHGDDAATALTHAMAEVRRQYPHPYHWAPFFLLGRPATSTEHRTPRRASIAQRARTPQPLEV